MTTNLSKQPQTKHTQLNEISSAENLKENDLMYTVYDSSHVFCRRFLLSTIPRLGMSYSSLQRRFQLQLTKIVVVFHILSGSVSGMHSYNSLLNNSTPDDIHITTNTSG